MKASLNDIRADEAESFYLWKDVNELNASFDS